MWRLGRVPPRAKIGSRVTACRSSPLSMWPFRARMRQIGFGARLVIELGLGL